MGTRYAYKCETCGLAAEVSGGPDVGMCCEWTTVWCVNCKSLSDSVTAAEDLQATSKWRSRTVTLPDDLQCPACEAFGLVNYEVGACPVCGSKMSVHDFRNDFWKIWYVCEPCDISVRREDCHPHLGIDPLDNVMVRLFCKTCRKYVMTSVHVPGSYTPFPKWRKHGLECKKCKSADVTVWNDTEPCPACGGVVRKSREPTAFVD